MFLINVHGPCGPCTSIDHTFTEVHENIMNKIKFHFGRLVYEVKGRYLQIMFIKNV